jgi:hypothetical protein
MLPVLAAGQSPTDPQPPSQPERADPDVLIDPLQPDFTLAALPTTLRLPRGKWGFRITHRFTRPLGEGNFGDLLADAFGADGGAQIGLEVRYGLARGTQVGVHRTSNKSIQFFGQHNLFNERDGAPVGLDALITVEGVDNFQDHYRAAVGAVVSRNAWDRAAFYAEPIWVANASPFDTGDNSTFLLGLGARARIGRAWYLFAEATPRIAGFDPGDHQISFGFERRAGGHMFQINFSNDFGTTFGQLATGARDYDNWYLGFNITRKFF